MKAASGIGVKAVKGARLPWLCFVLSDISIPFVPITGIQNFSNVII